MTLREDDAKPLDVPEGLYGYELVRWAVERPVGAHRLAWALLSVAELVLREADRAYGVEDDRPELAVASVRRWCLRQQRRDPTMDDLSGIGGAIITAHAEIGPAYSAMSYLLAFGPNYEGRADQDLYDAWLAMQHAGITLSDLRRETGRDGMARAVETFRRGLASPVVETRGNPPEGAEAGPEEYVTIVETQSPDQGQPWRLAEGFYADDVAIADITEGLAGRLAPATAVRVRLRVGASPTKWLGVVNRRGEVVEAPSPNRDAFLGWVGTWEEGWDDDDAEWFFKNIECVEYGLLAMAALECVEIARPVVAAGADMRAFDEAAANLRARAKERRPRAAEPASDGLYNVRLELSRLTARGPASASRTALEAMREACFPRRPDQCSPMIWRVPGLVVDAMSFGRGRSPRPSKGRKASLNAQMASIVRAWISIGVAMEASL